MEGTSWPFSQALVILGLRPSPRTAHSHIHVCTRPRTHADTRTLPPGEVSPKASSGLEEQSGWPGPHEGLAGPRCSLALHPPGPTSDGQPLSSLVVEFYPFLPGQFTQPRSSLEENFPHRILGPKGQHPDSVDQDRVPGLGIKLPALTHDDPSGPGLQDSPVYESVSQHHFSTPVGGVAAWFPGQQAKGGANTSGFFLHPGRGPHCLRGLGPRLQACVGPARNLRAQIGGLVFLCRRRRGRRWEGPSVGTRPELPPPVTNDPPVPRALGSSSAKCSWHPCVSGQMQGSNVNPRGQHVRSGEVGGLSGKAPGPPARLHSGSPSLCLSPPARELVCDECCRLHK